MNNLRDIVSSEEEQKTDEQASKEAEIDQAIAERERWLAFPLTQKLLTDLEIQSNIFTAEASILAYREKLTDTNKLTKAHTLRKVVEYARSNRTDW